MRAAFGYIGILLLVTNLFGVSMSPELEARLRDEGTFDQVVQKLQQARTQGVDKPDPHPFRPNLGEQTTLHALAILVDFSDNIAYTPAVHYDSLLSSQGIYSTGSLRDFFLENSYGNVDLIVTIAGWFRLPQTYAYYADGNYGFSAYPQNAQKMAEDAVWAADPTVDFSQFDNDNDGYVDALFIVHAGPGAEVTGNPNDIWSHAWSTVNVPYVDGVYAYGYSTEPEDGKIGVFCHEAGHNIFGLPDLYDYDYDSRGVGKWSLMANGSWNGAGNSPAHMDAFSKVKSEFVIPQVPTTNQTGVVFPRVMDHPYIYKVWTNGTPGLQYFLTENRQRVGFDYYLPGAGMLIYHVDEAQNNNNHQWYPGYTQYGHYLVAVEQADGLWELEKNYNSGNAGDPYPGNTVNRFFNSSTTPDSKDYNFNDTYVAVENISDSGDTMTADINVTPTSVEEFSVHNTSSAVLTVSPSIGRDIFTISYSLNAPAEISITIRDVSGRLVRSFEITGAHTQYTLVWQGNDNTGKKVVAGIYFIQMNARIDGATRGVSEIQKIIVL
jgi:immune inhibitor A